MTMYVEDSALILEQIAGKDKKDQSSFEKPVPKWSESLNEKNIKNLKVAVLNPKFLEKSCSPEVCETLQLVEDLFRAQGAVLKEVSLPFMEAAVPAYYLISTSEASSNLARYDGVRYGLSVDFKDKAPSLEEFYSRTRGAGFGAEVKRRILMGAYCLSEGYYEEYYHKASRIRRMIRDEFMKMFSDVSLLLAPVSDTPAFKKGQRPSGSLKSYLTDSFTVLANLAGLPALSAPAGFKNSLPVGVQLIAGHFNEQALFDTALLIQKELKAAGKRPF